MALQRKAESKTDAKSSDSLALNKSRAAGILADGSDELITAQIKREIKFVLKAKIADAVWVYDEARRRRMMMDVASEYKSALAESHHDLINERAESSYDSVIAVVSSRDASLAMENQRCKVH